MKKIQMNLLKSRKPLLPIEFWHIPAQINLFNMIHRETDFPVRYINRSQRLKMINEMSCILKSDEKEKSALNFGLMGAEFEGPGFEAGRNLLF